MLGTQEIAIRGIGPSNLATPPTPTGLLIDGTSLSQLGGAIGAKPNTYVLTHNLGGGLSGALAWGTDNGIPISFGFTNGVTGSTSYAPINNRELVNSQAAAGNPANATTGAASDASYSVSSGGNYALVNHPANYWALILFANDNPGYGGGYYNLNANPVISGPGRSMDNAATIADRANTQGKAVIVVTEPGRGPNTLLAERLPAAGNIVPGTTYFIVSNPGNNFTDGSDWENPQLMKDDTNRTLTRNRVSPANLNGDEYYCDNATSGYVFGPTGTGVGVQSQFAFANYSSGLTNGPTSTSQKVLRQWQLSSDPVFVDTVPGSLVNWGRPGLQYNRGKLCIVADLAALCWDANGNMKPGIGNDGLHLMAAGAMRANMALQTAWSAAWNGSPPSSWRDFPTYNTMRVGRSSAAQLIYNSGGGLIYNVNGSLNAVTSSNCGEFFFYYITGAIAGTIRICTLADIDGTKARISGAGVDPAANSNIMNIYTYATGAWAMTLNAGEMPAANNIFFGRGSSTQINCIPNCTFEDLNTPGTKTGTWTGIASVPDGWAISCDAGSDAQIAGGLLQINVTRDVSPRNGRPCLKIVVYGLAGGGTPQFQLASGAGTYLGSIGPQWQTGKALVLGCDMYLAPGPDGNLTGLFTHRLNMNTAIGAYNQNASWNAVVTAGQLMLLGTSTRAHTNMGLAGRARIPMPMIHAPIDTTGKVPTAGPAPDIRFNWGANIPVSFTAYVSMPFAEFMPFVPAM